MGSDKETLNQMMDEFYSTSACQYQWSIIHGDEFEVDAYDRLYTGRTKILRLLFFADRCDNHQMGLDALKMFNEIKKGDDTKDTKLFKEIVHKINGLLGPAYEMDLKWIENVESRVRETMGHLKRELHYYQSLNGSIAPQNVIKERLRIALADVGDLYFSDGTLLNVVFYYNLSYFQCTSPEHIVQSFLNIIQVYIEMGKFEEVTAYVIMAVNTIKALELVTVAKLACVAGLASLEAKDYEITEVFTAAKLACAVGLASLEARDYEIAEVVTAAKLACAAGLASLEAKDYEIAA